MQDITLLRIGVLRAVLYVPGARSLKDRRQAVVSLRDRIRARFEVSCHEVDTLDLPSRSELAVTTIGRDAALVRSVLDKITSFMHAHAACTVGDLVCRVIDWSGEELPLVSERGGGDV
jgi:uncharacterized protein YlxP (DUF503 family)